MSALLIPIAYFGKTSASRNSNWRVIMRRSRRDYSPNRGRRPISLVRCPNGPTGQCFFQRHVTDGMSSHVHGVKVAGHGEGKAYIYVDDAEGLVSLIQMGTIEFHAWGATVDAVKTPDRLIFDLDPAPDVAWSEVKQAALDVRSNLKSVGFSFSSQNDGRQGLTYRRTVCAGSRLVRSKGLCAVIFRGDGEE